MSTPDDKPTPLSQRAADPVDPPSWHGPIEEVKGRVTKLEAASVVTNAKLDAIEKKTDAQTIMLAEIKGVVSAATKNPYVRAISIGFALLVMAWLAKHGIKVEIPS